MDAGSAASKEAAQLRMTFVGERFVAMVGRPDYGAQGRAGTEYAQQTGCLVVDLATVAAEKRG
jgi:hypothetical protein